MAQKKETEKKNVKVRDLAPKKDAKGGARNLDSANLDSGKSLDRASLDGGQSLDRGPRQSLS